MQTTIEVTITDDKWPKVRAICRRSTTTGETTVSTSETLFDSAYIQIEAQVQNQLRPAVEELIRRRKR